MKTLLITITILLTASGFSVKAQGIARNTTGCDMEYRNVCLDVAAAPNCIVTSVWPVWTPVPAGTTTGLVLNGCIPPEVVAVEVRYAPSTGCPGSAILQPGPTVCNNYVPAAILAPCACNNNPNGNGVVVHFNGQALFIDP